MINGRTFFDQPTENDIKTYENIWKNTTGQANDYTTGCLLDYNYFKKHYKMKEIDLSKQQALDADPKAMQHVDFTVNTSGNNSRLIFSLLKKRKKQF